ncbi:DUF397 domain-containing protein [Streptomyces sp. JJ66]|uniref:DUF397 domain-containing protein n=1 Tax=Streptomyces sp. JJ66 TaxID=2803843 RepID=UPI001C58E197|nr:DUF397 domain-containing protein [Streptomyces sp. JJ66]MBW1601360.1 DUF397 domain-containing protein [Streptomyces sp. JJ66]
MSTPNLAAARWRKSSYSNGGDATCVEVSDSFPGVTPVRDSKAPNGPALLFLAGGWGDFVSAVKRGELSG